MSSFLALCCALWLTVGGAFAAQAEVSGLGSSKTGDAKSLADQGREIYNQACTVCHGVDGAAGERGPALAAARAYVRRTDDELFDAIRNGIKGTAMPSTGLSDDESRRVVAYIRSLRAKAADFPVEGDVNRGASLFEGAAECSRCHLVRGRGGLLGPDLTDIANRLPLKALRQALTVAKPRPPTGYEPAVIHTKQGQVLRGVLKNRHNFSYQLLSEDGRLHVLTADEVERVELGDKSLMPSDYDRRLTAREFRDLLAYLTRLTR